LIPALCPGKFAAEILGLSSVASKGHMMSCMKIRKFAAIAVLVLGSFAADNVAPTKAELEALYDKAFRAFDAGNFPEALKELDAIDARQPDVAESQNLRGVILMREGIYDKGEAALHEALRIDPKFWNARFNLAEIPFLKKDWGEARNRFQELLSSNASELQGEATQLIQYKILLTYLLEGKENMVDSILAKFELSPDTPAVHYSNAAIALQRKDAKEAKNWMVAAEKNFSPQLNKLFAESLYEVGWLEKQAGQSRAALELTTASERAAKMKEFAQSRFEEAQQATQQHDFAAARKFIDEADTAEPNQARILNLRGEILMEQKEFAQAEAEFKKALKADPKYREAQYNLAQIPFKQKEYAKARDRFEALFSRTPGGDKNQAAQLIKFKIYMTLLLEGKESRAQRMMEQFQFTGDTPSLYYAQAAWEFKHNNPTKATDWIASAKKIYSPALNAVFADAFYDLGWLQTPSLSTSPAPATEAAVAMESTQTESGPAIEPSPIPGVAVAKKGQAKESKAQASATASSAATPAIVGMEATASHAEKLAPATVLQPPANVPSESLAAGTPAKPEEMPAVPVPAVSPVVETPVTAASSPASSAIPSESAAVAESKPTASPIGAISMPSATPATVLAPAHVHELSHSSRFDWQTLLVGGLVVAGAALLGWVFLPEIRRRAIHFQLPSFGRTATANGPRISEAGIPGVAPAQKEIKASPRFVGGPRQISLRLKASEPSLRRAVVPIGKPTRMFMAPAEPVFKRNGEPEAAVTPPISEPVFESSVGPVVEQGVATTMPAAALEPSEQRWTTPVETAQEPPPVMLEPPATPEPPEPPVTREPRVTPETQEEESATPAPIAAQEPSVDLAEPEPFFGERGPIVVEPEPEPEPVGQGQPIPQLTPVMSSEPYTAETVTEPKAERIEVGELRQITEPPVLDRPTAFTEPVISQPTTSVIMPEPIQTPTASVVRTSAPGGAPQPGSMQTAVQLTFAFEIASMQLTPTFKMGAVQLRPASKIVTMRLATPSQHPQPAMNLQVSFEISRIQPSGGTLGSVRLMPSQQQRPSPAGPPSFTVAGLQVVSDFAAAPLQLTPSPQDHTSVHVTAPFQIATVEFSPSFEIASIVLNSSSKQVSVQLPGAGTVEGAPIFEIANLQLTGTGDIGMMQLHLLGQGPKRT
jgi:tetratricopeptide (TPR) repeat protein